MTRPAIKPRFTKPFSLMLLTAAFALPTGVLHAGHEEDSWLFNRQGDQGFRRGLPAEPVQRHGACESGLCPQQSRGDSRGPQAVCRSDQAVRGGPRPETRRRVDQTQPAVDSGYRQECGGGRARSA